MISEKYTFLVVENAVDVCEGIERRMKQFEQWRSLGYCVNVKQAIERIKDLKPQLVYLDWSLNGGSAFEVLQQIQGIDNYNPYIIFNTGFQSDNPEIPQEVVNNYKVDKYLVKPFWEKLRLELPQYIKEAEAKANDITPKPKIVWLIDDTGAKVQLPINKIICITQHPEHPRKRIFYVETLAKEITIPLGWEKCFELLNEHSVNYFITKTREHVVIKNYVEKFDKPFVRLKNIPFKIEVVKEKLRDFSDWLDN